LILLHFIGVGVLNFLYAPYPADNDLQFIGWMAEHLRLSRPESLVNQNYPFGFPLTLKILTPVFGSIVYAAYFCQTVASTVAVALVFQLARRIYSGSVAGFCAAFAAAAVNLPVATTEFADSIATVAILAGLCLLAEDLMETRRHFVLGAMVGAAFLFRFHYLTFLLILPAALLLCRPGLKTVVSCSLAEVAGFALAAAPLLVLNLVVRGNPFHTGFASYIVGHNVVEAVDWNDFLATYDLWPLGRVLKERPLGLLRQVLRNLGSFLHAFSLFALAATVAGVRLSKEEGKPRRFIGYLFAVTLGYVFLDILLTRYTNRAAYPAFALLSVLSMGALVTHVAPLLPRWHRGALAAAAATATAVLAVHMYKFSAAVASKRRAMQHNQVVLRVMKAHGLASSSDAFCTDWNFYNLYHPYLEPFHDYGGYMLLDPEYAAVRPVPRCSSLAEWRDFVDEHGIRFLVPFKGLPAPGIPIADVAARYPKIFSDERLDVFLMLGDAG
jgi:hypothetical protein